MIIMKNNILPIPWFDDYDVQYHFIQGTLSDELLDVFDSHSLSKKMIPMHTFRHGVELPVIQDEILDKIIKNDLLYNPLSVEVSTPTDQLAIYCIQLLKNPSKEIMDKIIEMTELIFDTITKDQAPIVAQWSVKRYNELFLAHLCSYLFEHNELIVWQYDDDEFELLLGELNDLEEQDIWTDINDKIKNIDEEYRREKFSNSPQKSMALEKLYKMRSERFQHKKIITRYYDLLMKYFVSIVEQASYSQAFDVDSLTETYAQLMKTKKVLDYL